MQADIFNIFVPGSYCNRCKFMGANVHVRYASFAGRALHSLRDHGAATPTQQGLSGAKRSSCSAEIIITFFAEDFGVHYAAFPLKRRCTATKFRLRSVISPCGLRYERALCSIFSLLSLLSVRAVD